MERIAARRFFASVAAALLLFAALTAAGCGKAPGNATAQSDAEAPTERQTEAPLPEDALARVTGDVYLTEFFSYSGPFTEDGSDEPCEGIAAVRIVNRSDAHYEYLSFSLDTPEGTCEFEASTLLAGASMTVLEKNRAAYDGNAAWNARLLRAAEFPAAPTVHLDTLEISFTDGFLNVRNLTADELKNVTVCYKSTDEYGFFGGITYRVRFGDLAANGAVQKTATHIRKDGSRVVFSDYVR